MVPRDKDPFSKAGWGWGCVEICLVRQCVAHYTACTSKINWVQVSWVQVSNHNEHSSRDCTSSIPILGKLNSTTVYITTPRCDFKSKKKKLTEKDRVRVTQVMQHLCRIWIVNILGQDPSFFVNQHLQSHASPQTTRLVWELNNATKPNHPKADTVKQLNHKKIIRFTTCQACPRPMRTFVATLEVPTCQEGLEE